MCIQYNMVLLVLTSYVYATYAGRYLGLHILTCFFVCLFWTLYSLSDSKSLQVWLDLCRTHQSMKIRQLPWSSGLQPNDSVCGRKQHQVTLHTTQQALCSRLGCQLRMSHVVLMLVYIPSWSVVYSHWTEILTWISHSVSSYISNTFTFIHIFLFISPVPSTP